jgi:hypothetical protein
VLDYYSKDRQLSTVYLAEERCVESKRNYATIEGQVLAAVQKRMLLPRILEGLDTHRSIKELTTA